jgi:hypothetical protein
MKRILIRIAPYLVMMTFVAIGLSTLYENPFKSIVWILIAILLELVGINAKLEKLNGAIPVIRLWKTSNETDKSGGQAG